MKQTAVEWLAEQMLHPESHNPYIEQALEMEKEQMEDSYCFGILDSGEDGLGFNHYYNETFKSE